MTSPQSSPSGAPESGRALDAMVAEKVMDLTRENWPRICFVDGHSTDEDTWCYSCGGMIDEQEQVPPAFSSDIASAWMVVEKMRAKDYGFWLSGEATSQRTGWKATFTTEFDDFFAYAEAMPLAICRAALPSTGAETAE